MTDANCEALRPYISAIVAGFEQHTSNPQVSEAGKYNLYISIYVPINIQLFVFIMMVTYFVIYIYSYACVFINNHIILYLYGCLICVCVIYLYSNFSPK